MVSGVPHRHNRRRNSLLAYQQGNNNNQDYQVMAAPLTAVDVLSPFIQIRRPLTRRLLRQSSRAISQLLISPFFWSDFERKPPAAFSIPIKSSLLIVFEFWNEKSKQINFKIFLCFNCFGLHFAMQCVCVQVDFNRSFRYRLLLILIQCNLRMSIWGKLVCTSTWTPCRMTSFDHQRRISCDHVCLKINNYMRLLHQIVELFNRNLRHSPNDSLMWPRRPQRVRSLIGLKKSMSSLLWNM